MEDRGVEMRFEEMDLMYEELEEAEEMAPSDFIDGYAKGVTCAAAIVTMIVAIVALT